MVFVCAIAKLHTLEELIGDVRISGCCQQRWEPVEPGENTVLHGTGLDVTGPADNGGNAITPFKAGTLLAFKRGVATIRPGEGFRAIVGGKDNDGIVCLTDIVQMLQNLTDAVIQLGHAGFLRAVIALEIHHRLVLRRDVGKDVHASGVVPDEEWLAILLGLVHGAGGVSDEHFVKSRHVIFGRAALLPILYIFHAREWGQWAFVLNLLSSYLAPARLICRVIAA